MLPNPALPADASRHLLLIDTCAAGSVALAALEPKPGLLGQELLPGRTASERLLAAIRALVEQHHAHIQELRALAVVHGPGSFTGVRVAVSAAKGLAEALTIPIVAISRLAVLAAHAPPERETLGLLDAGRSEFYCGHYRSGKCISEELLTRDALSDFVAHHPAAGLIACEPEVASSVKPHPITVIPELTAADALPLAVIRISQSEFADPVTLDANYVRRTGLFAKSSLPSPRDIAATRS